MNSAELQELREFLTREYPLEEQRELFEAEIGETEQLALAASEKLQEARLVEEETLRKLKLGSERDYDLGDFLQFLKELNNARDLKKDATALAERRVELLKRLVANEEIKLELTDDLLKSIAKKLKCFVTKSLGDIVLIAIVLVTYILTTLSLNVVMALESKASLLASLFASTSTI